MKKLFDNSYLVISLYLLFSFIIDIMTNLTLNLSFSIGMILRGLLLLYLLLGLLIKYKSKSNYIILAILGAFSSSYLIFHHNLLGITNLFKYNFVIILLLFLKELYQKEDKKINRNILTLCLLFYSFSIIIAWLTNTAVDSYAISKVGTVGWFNSANEVSAIISIILSYIFVNLQKRINIIEIFAILVSLFAAFLIGTRLPILVALICILYIFIKKFIKDAKEKNVNYTNLLIFILFLITFAIKFKDTPIYKNLVIHIKYLKLDNPFKVFTSFKLFDHFVFNRRLTFLLNLNKFMIKSSLSAKLFGLNVIKKAVEMDIFDIFYIYGVIGFILFTLLTVYIIKKLINRKDVYYLPIAVILVTSFLSGHVLLSPNVTLIALVIISNTLYKKKRRKVLYSLNNLKVGGVGNSLISILERLDNKKYEITLYLESKNGELINSVPSNIRLRTHKVFKTRFNILNKILNSLNNLKYLITNFKEYDFGCCYDTEYISSNFIARYASNNSCIYIHSDYTKLYENDIKKINDFFNKRKLDKFKKIVFISNEAKENVMSLYPRFIDKSIVINNFIDSSRYIKLSDNKINEAKPKGKKLFLSVGKIEESSKNLTRMVNAFKLALEEDNKIELWIIGSGPDENKIKDLISLNKLENSIKMLGSRANPYPYIKMSDYVILTSNYEGFPFIYGEAITFKKPIITTIDVSNDVINIKNNFGYICKKNEKDVSNTILNAIKHHNFKYKEIDLDKSNEITLKKIEKLINY